MSQLLIALSCASSSPRSVFKLLAPHDVDVHDFEVTGRGLRTLRDRELGEALLELPDSSVVLAERVLETDSRLAAAAAHAAELGTPLSDEGLLACFVAQAMGDGAAAHATADEYVCTLPAAQDSALTMGERERALLPRCYLRATETFREVAVKEHASCAAALEGTGQPAPPLELFLRARAHVRARSVGFSEDECTSYRLQPASPLLARDTRGTRRALMPFYDLINHRCGTRTLLVRTKQGAWRLHAGCAYQRGEQLFVSYGERDNLRWLLHYGFALPDNPEQVRVRVRLRVSVSSTTASRYPTTRSR